MSWQPVPMPKSSAVSSGRLKSVEATDPYVAAAVELTTPGHDGTAAMARTFVEEFARIGWSRDRIERMFRQPRFPAAHAVYRTRGAEFVEDVINDVLGPESPAGTDWESSNG